jgi:hypothetical protein
LLVDAAGGSIRAAGWGWTAGAPIHLRGTLDPAIGAANMVEGTYEFAGGGST